jgi:hypothetical protein
MQNPSQPAQAPDPFLRALADLESALAELQMPDEQEDEGMNALAGMQAAPQSQQTGANALAQMVPMTRGAAGYHGGAR